MREAVLLTICDPLPEQFSRLENLSEKDWQKLLHWLDISGLALYFLDRMVELQMCSMLPAAVLARLQRNLQDNIERTRGMIAESVGDPRGVSRGAPLLRDAERIFTLPRFGAEA